MKWTFHKTQHCPLQQQKAHLQISVSLINEFLWWWVLNFWWTVIHCIHNTHHRRNSITELMLLQIRFYNFTLLLLYFTDWLNLDWDFIPLTSTELLKTNKSRQKDKHLPTTSILPILYYLLVSLKKEFQNIHK